jgi:protein TonB
VIGSAALHLALVAGMLWWPTSRASSRIRPDAIAVSLTGGFPAQRTQVRAETPPAPKPEPTEPKPKPTPEGASLETNPVKVDKTPKKTTPEPEPAPPEEPAGTGAEASESDVPEAGGPVGEVGVAGGTIASLNLGDIGLAWYASSVQAALQTHYNPPILVGTRDVLVTVVSFDLRRDGSVVRPRIESSSGVPSMDRAALRAVADAQPLPSLPSEVSEPFLPVRVKFQWSPGDS